jgi:hypothetical protein
LSTAAADGEAAAINVSAVTVTATIHRPARVSIVRSFRPDSPLSKGCGARQPRAHRRLDSTY